MKLKQLILIVAALAACKTARDTSYSRFADKQVQCADADAKGVALCKRKDGAAFVCFVEDEDAATVYCIRAVDPLDAYKPAAEVAQ